MTTSSHLRRLTRLGLLLALVALVAAPQAWAQRGPQDDRGPVQRIERHVTTLQEQLGLTDAQTEQVRAVLTEQGAARRALRERYGRDEREAARTEMRQLRAQTQERLEAILTPEQAAKYREFAASKRARSGERGHRRGGRPDREGGDLERSRS